MLVGGQADDLAGREPVGAIGRPGADSPPQNGCHDSRVAATGRAGRRGDEQQLAALDEYGEKLGLAFQIIDDWLDVQGDEVAMGKRLRKDSQHGKLTFPALLGVEESRRRAEQLVDEACERIARLGPRASNLEALARYVLERNH